MHCCLKVNIESGFATFVFLLARNCSFANRISIVVKLCNANTQFKNKFTQNVRQSNAFTFGGINLFLYILYTVA